MAAIKTFNINNLPNDNHLPFGMNVRDYALQSEAVSTNFSALVNPFVAAVAAEDLAMHPQRASDLTELIEETDKARDAAYYVVNHTVDVFLHYPDGQEKTDAAKVEKYLKTNGVDRKAQYDRETGMILNLVQDLERYCAEEVERLGMTEQVARLKALNEQMYDLLQQRDEMLAAKEKSAVAEARKVTDRLYHGIVAAVNSVASVDPEPYLTFIRQMNQTIDRLNLQVFKIIGSSADKNEADGFEPGLGDNTEGGDLGSGGEDNDNENTYPGGDDDNNGGGGTNTPGGSIPTNPQPGDGDDPDLYIYGF